MDECNSFASARVLNFKVHPRLGFTGRGVYREDSRFRLSSRTLQPWIDCSREIGGTTNRRRIRAGESADRILENKKKRGGEREREKGGRDRAHKSRGVR